MRLDLRHGTLVRIAGLDEELRLYTEVRDVVMLFVGSYCIFGITQFIGDNRQALIDESGRVGRNQVLIHHCIEVVLLDELMQERLVSFRHSRDAGENDDIRFFLMLRYGETGAILGYHLFATRMGNAIGSIGTEGTVGMNDKGTDAGLYGCTQGRHLHGRTTEEAHLRLDLKAFLIRMYRHGKLLLFRFLGQVHILDGDGRITELTFPSPTATFDVRIP